MVLATTIAMSIPAFAQTASFEASVAQLAADNFSDKIAAVDHGFFAGIRSERDR